MHVQLQPIAQEYRAAAERLDRLVAAVPAARWSVRPGEGRWSISECVDHLNRTAEAFLPAIRSAMAAAESLRGAEARRFRRDVVGWLLSVIMPPPVRLVRARTSGVFVPVQTAAPAELVRRFHELQREQMACLEAADGLPLDRIRVPSPFNPRVRYNLYSCFVILPRHEHRHLWQAEQAAASLTQNEGTPG